MIGNSERWKKICWSKYLRSRDSFYHCGSPETIMLKTESSWKWIWLRKTSNACFFIKKKSCFKNVSDMKRHISLAFLILSSRPFFEGGGLCNYSKHHKVHNRYYVRLRTAFRRRPWHTSGRSPRSRRICVYLYGNYCEFSAQRDRVDKIWSRRVFASGTEFVDPPNDLRGWYDRQHVSVTIWRST